MADLSVTCSFLEVDAFGFSTLQDKLQEAEAGKEWKIKGNADFAVALQHKLLCFRLLSGFLLSSLSINYFGLKVICTIKKENLSFFVIYAVIKVIHFSQKSNVQPEYLGHFKGMYNG